MTRRRATTCSSIRGCHTAAWRRVCYAAAVYVSIRCLSRRRAEDIDFAASHLHAKTFEGSDYKDCAMRSLSSMEKDDKEWKL